jgi:hypothetical protein
VVKVFWRSKCGEGAVRLERWNDAKFLRMFWNVSGKYIFLDDVECFGEIGFFGCCALFGENILIWMLWNVFWKIWSKCCFRSGLRVQRTMLAKLCMTGLKVVCDVLLCNSFRYSAPRSSHAYVVPHVSRRYKLLKSSLRSPLYPHILLANILLQLNLAGVCVSVDIQSA